MLRDRMLATPLQADDFEERIGALTALLRTWSRRINLVAPADLPHLRTRHIDDSLRLLPFVPPGTDRAIDLGSGAGFPGLILAIATGIHVHLIESDRRKAAFLMEAARITAAPATVHATRIEAATMAPASLVTARALAPLDRLLALATPLLAPGGTLLFLKGARAAEELDVARQHWTFTCTEHRGGKPGPSPAAATQSTATPILAITDPARIDV